ncbi:alpha/beta hydrolase [Dictyobacter alpinus]|uniref:Alpha/beta hydrolase n=1 Tax=Dictyobacter alpinus TaxID=2014873 RepID=A0A402BCS5_9CHLR|nr:alpha/beta hydrolase [Dictyobacter alpinus]GCE29134.1 alpha/beta hydrolase [Dictyobacter alpinus]
MSEENSNLLNSTPSEPKKPFLQPRLTWKQLTLTLLLLLIVIWAFIPAIRSFTLVANSNRSHQTQTDPAGLPVKNVQFTATDGIKLSGWLAIANPQAPTIILVHGFKGNRTEMIPAARILYTGGYNVLLYDSRGCGASEGWEITLGAREPLDVLGAVKYLKGRSDLSNKHFGLVGNSLGSGIVLMAAAREPSILATVADSVWVDSQAQTNRMGSLNIGPLTLPLLPYEPALVDQLIGGQLTATRPIDAIHQLSPRAVLLIQSADDQNTTTPPSGEHQLFAAAGEPKQEWIVPTGGHTGAVRAHHDEYAQRVLAFFNIHLKLT